LYLAETLHAEELTLSPAHEKASCRALGSVKEIEKREALMCSIEEKQLKKERKNHRTRR